MSYSWDLLGTHTAPAPCGPQHLQVTSVQTQMGSTNDLIMYHVQTHPEYAGLNESIWNNSIVCTATASLRFPDIQQPSN